MIKGGNTTIYVTDMDRAVTFYTEALGLTVLYRAGNHYCLVDAGDGLKLGLHPSSEHSPKPGVNGSTIVGFGVNAPMEQVVAALGEKGVTFKGPITDDESGPVRFAYFSDLDGNDMYLAEAKSWG
jgi:catechol 2,3-dioxygenase-like lactoylglutathione lyase family enzyme